MVIILDTESSKWSLEMRIKLIILGSMNMIQIFNKFIDNTRLNKIKNGLLYLDIEIMKMFDIITSKINTKHVILKRRWVNKKPTFIR